MDLLKTEDPIVKREKFSVSLRNSKKEGLVSEKRLRAMKNISKSKFQASIKDRNYSSEEAASKSASGALFGMLVSLNSTLSLPLGHKDAFSFEEISEVLKEIYFQVKTRQEDRDKIDNGQGLIGLARLCDREVSLLKDLLLGLLKKEVEVQLSPLDTASHKVKFESFIKVYSFTFEIMANFSYERAAESNKISSQVLKLGINFIDRYFLKNNLGVAEIVKAKNLEKLASVVELLFDAVYMLNNSVVRTTVDCGEHQVGQAFKMGISSTYSAILEVYTGFEKQVGAQLLEPKFWEIILWGLFSLGDGIKSLNKTLITESEVRSLDGIIENYGEQLLSSGLSNRAEQDFLFICMRLVQNPPQGPSIFKFKFIEKAFIKQLVFSQFKQGNTFDKNSMLSAFVILSELLYSDEDGSLAFTFLEQSDVLQAIQLSLLKGGVYLKRESLFVLSNLACDERCAETILASPSSVSSNVLFSLKSSDQAIKHNSMFAIGNLCVHATPDRVQILVRSGLFQILNDEILAFPKETKFIAFALQTLNAIFDKLEWASGDFYEKHGEELFEFIQHLPSRSVKEAFNDLMEAHYDFHQEEEMAGGNSGFTI